MSNRQGRKRGGQQEGGRKGVGAGDDQDADQCGDGPVGGQLCDDSVPSKILCVKKDAIDDNTFSATVDKSDSDNVHCASAKNTAGCDTSQAKPDSQNTRCTATKSASECNSNTPQAIPDNVKATSRRLGRQFYEACGEDLARNLLGKRIVRMVDGARLSARIVETEAYLGGLDKAAHSFKGQTDRNQAMFMQPGTAYVYTIYGIHYCFNISCGGAGCAVLIRSVEPLEGVERMGELRKVKGKSSSSTAAAPSSFKVHQLANGPGKLCQALNITKQHLNQHDLVTDTGMWLEDGDAVSATHVVVSARINIAYAEEWTDKPLRFYELHNRCVSVRNKAAEKLLEAAGTCDMAAVKLSISLKTAEDTGAAQEKTSKKKVKASGVGNKTGKKGVTAQAKSAKKGEGTTSEYFD
ncbi:DNA-3-methyladenine glycosylase-like [Babylonia areolata]|uniref:DNA-3-methyladenine glycosylase-like n=1 Tax=Babylonia areolata TaxID=304850 RepID=UPI003FD0422F